MSMAEMKMLKWISEVSREDKIRNEYIRRSIEVAPIVDEIKTFTSLLPTFFIVI